jgi:hypothetical protein
MSAQHLEILVEEASMEAFLQTLMPRLLPANRTFLIHPFQGKSDLLSKLGKRLVGYSKWLPPDSRIVVVLDRDDDDCAELKQRLEKVVSDSHLRSKTSGQIPWQVVSRIAIEELEAWYFGDWSAVLTAYPRVPRTIPAKAPYRDPDAIAGGTWEAFERILAKAGYYKTGLPKIETARTLGALIDHGTSTSASFRHFCAAINEAVSSTGAMPQYAQTQRAFPSNDDPQE